MRIALVYDCIHPPTVGGAERWLRALAEDLSRDHDVTYLTRHQWAPGQEPIAGVRCVAVSPGGPLTDAAGRRRILPMVSFGAGVLVHLQRHRRDYAVERCLSYPYLSVLGARLALAGRRAPAFLVEWLECLTPGYWRWYAGRLAGTAGSLVQWLCVRATPAAICFSQHTERRLVATGLRGSVRRLGGLWDGEAPADNPSASAAQPPFLLFAGRHVPDKQVTAIPAALSRARMKHPSLRAVLVGEGPCRGQVQAEVARLGLDEAVDMPGFVTRGRLDDLMAAAVCVVAPSRRDGHGMVVAEAAAAGTPVVAVVGPDTALPSSSRKA